MGEPIVDLLQTVKQDNPDMKAFKTITFLNILVSVFTGVTVISCTLRLFFDFVPEDPLPGFTSDWFLSNTMNGFGLSAFIMLCILFFWGEGRHFSIGPDDPDIEMDPYPGAIPMYIGFSIWIIYMIVSIVRAMVG